MGIPMLVKWHLDIETAASFIWKADINHVFEKKNHLEITPKYSNW